MKTKDMPKWKAPKIIFGIFFVLFLVLFIQYCYLAIFPNIYGINMKEFASKRNTYSTTLYSKRGTIYDGDGNALALDISSYTVIAYLDPSRTGSSDILYHVEDKEGTAKALAPILNMEESYLLKLLNSGLYQVELGPGGRGITEITKSQIEALNLPGIAFVEGYKRYYPNGNFASYIVGYAKQQDELIEGTGEYQKQIVGEMGIEVKFDELLKGQNGYLKYQQDRFGYKIPDTKEEKVEAKNGGDIYLTLDSNIQRMIEASISEAQDKYEPDWITINVMDAKTGDILGSASTPSFDPNLLNITNYENPLTSFVYEPGSVMKIFTYMCAIDKGTYKGSETYPSGRIQIEDKIISDWNQVGWGDISFDFGFEMSSNVAVSYIMQRFLTKDDLKGCLTKYGFGDQTGIELPRELMGTLNFEFPVEIAAASYGQGISTTPIQHLQALSIIANNGKMVKPHIIKKIVDPNSNEVTYERKVEYSDQIVKESTVEYIKKLMYNTVNDVENHATGIGYRVPGMNVLGKTGTAEIFDNNQNIYLHGWRDYIFSFSGIFPKEDPEIIIFVSFKRPNTGTTSAIINTTQPLLESIAKYKGLIDGGVNEKPAQLIDVESYVNQKTEDITKQLKDKELSYIVLGDGEKIIDQYPKAGSKILTGETIYLVTNSKEYKMPNLVGLSRLEAITICHLLNLNYEFENYGYVTEQSIKKGTVIEKDMTVKLKLEPKHTFD